MGKITIRDLSFAYEDNNIFDRINLEINKGEFFTLLGPSGCGKTTLLRLIAGFLIQTDGEIFLEKKKISNVPSQKRDIGTVFQNYALFPHLNVEENIAFGLKIKRYSREKIEKTINHYLDMVGLRDFKKRSINELSGGQQQRIALARSLAVEPKVLLLDEPMSNLDISLREEMCSELKKIQKNLQITTVFVTHNQEEALSISDRIAVMEKGITHQIGSPHDIYHNPSTRFVANFVGKTNELSSEFIQKYNIKSDISKYIRPEQIRLSNVKQSDSVKGVVSNVIFKGSMSTYQCDVDNWTFVVNELSSPIQSYEVGETVYINFL